MEIIDKDKLEAYRKNYQLESMLLIPIYLPAIFIVIGLWFPAAVVLGGALHVFFNTLVFKLARQNIPNFAASYFAIVAAVAVSALLSSLFPNNNFYLGLSITTILAAAILSYVLFISKLKKVNA